ISVSGNYLVRRRPTVAGLCPLGLPPCRPDPLGTIPGSHGPVADLCLQYIGTARGRPVLHVFSNDPAHLTLGRRMATKQPERQTSKPTTSVVEWLLDSDPSIRWQVMRDLTDEPAEVVAAERSRVGSEGWGARVLGLQQSDGTWGDDIAAPKWASNLYSLLLLRALGLDPESDRARKAVSLVRDQVTWGSEFGNSPFFEGEV